MYAIKLEKITKSFKSISLFSELSYEFATQTCYGIKAPNGSGKSVLFKIIMGFIAPDSGHVDIDARYRPKNSQYPLDFGILVDQPGYIGHLSGRQNLEYLASIRNIIGKQKIIDTMTLVGLDPDNRTKTRNYSLGMKQRLGIAQAIMEDPKVLLLDEPFNALDTTGQKQITDILRKQKENGVTLIFTSHQLEDIESLADVALTLDAQKLKPV